MARPVQSPSLVGRETELALLEEALRDARAGVTRVVTVGGEAGIGKSRLVAELMGRARRDGAAVHHGLCPPAIEGAAHPYAPFDGVLRSIVRSIDARRLDQLLGTTRRELAALLPELGEHEPGVDAAHGASRLFDSVLLLLERVATTDRPLLLVLEDLQWADRSARSLLAWLVHQLVDPPVLVVATHRTDIGPDDPLPGLLADLDRLGSVVRLELGPLTTADAETLLAAIHGTALPPALTARIVERSGGVPLYLEELTVMGAEDAPPTSIRTSVDRRLVTLDPIASRVVRLVAVAGRPVDARLLGAAAGLDTETLLGAIGQATRAGLLRSTSVSDPNGVAVRHALLGEAIAATFVPGESGWLHASWAATLRDHLHLGPAAPIDRTAALARHLLGADERDAAVPALIASGTAARDARAFPEAAAAYERAIALAGPRLATLVVDPVGLFDDAAQSSWLAGSPQRAASLGDQAMRMAGGSPRDGDGWRRRLRQATYQAAAGFPTIAEDLLIEIATHAPSGPIRWQAQVELGRVLTRTGRHLEAADHCRAARELARAAGDRRAAARAGAALSVSLSSAGRHADALAALTDSRRDLGSVGDASHSRSRLSRLPDSLLELLDEATVLAQADDAEASLRVALRARDAASQLGLLPAFGPVLAAAAAWDLVCLGRWDEAADGLRAATPVGRQGGPWTAMSALLAARRGDWAIAASHSATLSPASLAPLAGTDWPVVAALAVVETARGQGRTMVAADAVQGAFAGPDPWAAGSLVLAELAVLGVAVEADRAAAARQRRDPAAGGSARDAAMELGAAARSVLAAQDGGGSPRRGALWARLDAELMRATGVADPGAWERAVHAVDATPDGYAAATARLELASALLDAAADRQQVAGHLRDAYALADRLGATPVLAAIEVLARRARVALPAGRPSGVAVQPARAAAASLGLSAREIDVMELLALGSTDREVAQRLFITEKTAGHHVSHILTKLQVSRRGEAAAVAHRLGLVGPDPDALPG